MPFGNIEYKTIVKVVYIMAVFMQILDGTIVNVAIPTLADEFGVDDTQIDLAIISFLVSLAVFLPTSGWLGDRFGSKPIFLGALTIFTLASALAGTSSTLDQLVLWRIFQGAASGIMTPLGSAMLFRAFPQNERAKATTAVIGVAVVAPALGPVLGGFLIEVLNWRWIFYVNVPMGVAALVLGSTQLRNESGESNERFDVVGFLLSGVGLAVLLFAVDRAKDDGFGSGPVLAGLMAGVALLVTLIIHQLRVKEPLLHLRLLSSGIFRASSLVSFPTYMGFMSLIFILPVYLQSLLGYSPFETGLAMMPQPIGVMISSQIVGRSLYKKYGPRRILQFGIGAAFVIGLAFAFLLNLTTSLWLVAALSFARGLAMGAVFLPLQTATYAQTTYAETAKATTLYGMQRQLGPAVGIATAATILGSMNNSLPDNALADRLDGFRVAMLASAAFFAIAGALSRTVRDEDAASTLT